MAAASLARKKLDTLPGSKSTNAWSVREALTSAVLVARARSNRVASSALEPRRHLDGRNLGEGCTTSFLPKEEGSRLVIVSLNGTASFVPRSLLKALTRS